MRMKRKAGSVVVVAVMAVMVLGSCLKTDDPVSEDKSIELFLGNNPDVTFTKTESGLYYHVVEAGSGDIIQPHDTAHVTYTAQSLSGIVYDSNVGYATYNFPVGEEKSVPGFDEGVLLMKEGGKFIFLIPSALAYGTYGSGPIPPSTPLLFEVLLVKIARGPAK